MLSELVVDELELDVDEGLDDELSEEFVLDEELELSSDEVDGREPTPCRRIPSCLKPLTSRIAVAALVGSSRKGTVSLNHSETCFVNFFSSRFSTILTVLRGKIISAKPIDSNAKSSVVR